MHILFSHCSVDGKSKKQLKKEAKDAEKAAKKEAHKVARVSVPSLKQIKNKSILHFVFLFIFKNYHLFDCRAGLLRK